MDIDIFIEEGLPGCPGEEWLRRLVEQVLMALGTEPGAGLSLALSGDERVRQLNREFRGLDEPTDVLSFGPRSEGGGEPFPFILPPEGPPYLGDIIISCPQAVRQASAQGHPVETEIAVLLVHGVLHLLGYEHGDPESERAMKEKEAEVLGRVKLE
ncbi:MAG: rRNA maturation RNase YbeY [Chloroflexi bacterium]|nr:rRNA maturation RNase YbeY [Chloroflexota bacterium]